MVTLELAARRATAKAMVNTLHRGTFFMQEGSQWERSRVNQDRSVRPPSCKAPVYGKLPFGANCRVELTEIPVLGELGVSAERPTYPDSDSDNGTVFSTCRKHRFTAGMFNCGV